MKRQSAAVAFNILAALCSPFALRAQSSERPAPIEFVTPKPPTPVMANGRRLLVYEIHVTNLGTVPLGFRRLEVYASGNGPHSIVDTLVSLSDSALRNASRPMGGTRTGDVSQLAVGKRSVVFVWLELPLRSPIPQRLRHRLVFTPLDSAGTPIPRAESAIDSLWVPVLPASRVAILRAPVPAGVWLAGIGPSNDSDHRRSLTALEGRGFISQRFAVDWVNVGPNGDTHHDAPNRNENFWAYGQPVLAVSDGDIAAVVDGLPDNTPRAPLSGITIKTIAGNHVTLQIGPNQFATYAHLRPGSIRVRVGQHVRRGDVLAQLGNSGASTAPHLHLQVTDGPAVLASEGIPFVLERFELLGYGRDYEPGKGTPSVRLREMPLYDYVVRIR